MDEITVNPPVDNYYAMVITFGAGQKYECELFGLGPHGMIYRPLDKDVPNFFWRWMQYLILGNKWKRIKC